MLQKLFIGILVMLFIGCSNKYDSLYQSAPAPGLGFNHDTIIVREKDDRNLTGNGRLVLYCSSPAHQLNIQLYDTSGKVHVMYRGEEINNGSLVPVIDSVVLFVYCDSVGLYALDYLLTDRLGKVAEKTLVVKSVDNLPAAASFFYTPLPVIQSQSWPYRFDASLSHDPDGVIVSYFFSVNGQVIETTTATMDWHFHAKGEQVVGLFVVDELGRHSDTVVKKIMIL